MKEGGRGRETSPGLVQEIGGKLRQRALQRIQDWTSYPESLCQNLVPLNLSTDLVAVQTLSVPPQTGEGDASEGDRISALKVSDFGPEILAQDPGREGGRGDGGEMEGEMEGGRKGEREGGREGRREGVRDRGREREREGGRGKTHITECKIPGAHKSHTEVSWTYLWKACCMTPELLAPHITLSFSLPHSQLRTTSACSTYITNTSPLTTTQLHRSPTGIRTTDSLAPAHQRPPISPCKGRRGSLFQCGTVHHSSGCSTCEESGRAVCTAQDCPCTLRDDRS